MQKKRELEDGVYKSVRRHQLNGEQQRREMDISASMIPDREAERQPVQRIRTHSGASSSDAGLGSTPCHDGLSPVDPPLMRQHSERM